MYVNLDAVMRLTRAESKQRTRARLIASGLKSFARHGFHAASVDEIADNAGYTRGAFYANFADKGDLFMTILEERRAKDMAEITTRLETAADAEKLGVLQQWFEKLTGNQALDLAYAEFWPHAIRNRQLRRRLARRQQATRDAIAASANEYLCTTGITLPLPIEHVAGMMLAIAEGVLTQSQLDPAGLPDDAFTTTTAYLWFGLLSQTSHPA